MAAYAAFKHVELYNVGKAKKRVLRPPGGGSSDIFGSDMPQTPRSVKNHMASNIFSCEKDSAVKNNVRQGAHRFYFIGDGPRRGQKNVDSYTRLFGEPERPVTPAKNHMRSNIPFGANGEVSHQLLTNGNGHFTNGKSGSVSSASSSVSSSTENLKMNGVSRSVFRNMSILKAMSKKLEIDSACSESPPPTPKEEKLPDTLDIDRSCIDSPERNDNLVLEYKKYTESDARDVASQTRKDNGNNPMYPYSFTDVYVPATRYQNSLYIKACIDESKKPVSTCIERQQEAANKMAQHPIRIPMGLNDDDLGGSKTKKQKAKEGNPVTGEGYKSGANEYQQPQTMNGANQVINKNRVPPGGYSSGLW